MPMPITLGCGCLLDPITNGWEVVSLNVFPHKDDCPAADRYIEYAEAFDIEVNRIARD